MLGLECLNVIGVEYETNKSSIYHHILGKNGIRVCHDRQGQNDTYVLQKVRLQAVFPYLTEWFVHKRHRMAPHEQTTYLELRWRTPVGSRNDHDGGYVN